MKYNNLANKKSIDQFVSYKLELLNNKEVSFKTLFELMFSEKENTFYEYNKKFKVIKITYGEAYKDILNIAFTLKKSIKLPLNSIIGLYLNNDIHWLEVFWALLYLGYRPLLLNSKLTDDVLNNLIKESGCELVVSNGKNFDVDTLNYFDLKIEEGFIDSSFADEILFLSSGTSSVKICAYTSLEITNIVKKAKEVVLANSRVKKHYEGELKLLALLPFYHIFGFVAVYLWFTFFSRTLVELTDLSNKNVLFVINHHKVTHIFAVPLLWNKVYDSVMKEISNRGEKTLKKFNKGLKLSLKLGNSFLGRVFRKVAFKEIRDNLFLDHISFMISGGSFIDRKVLEFFNGIGYHLTNGYGSTEIGITSVELSNKFKYITSGSIGKPLDKINYRINDNHELLVKGNSLADYLLIKGEKHPHKEDEWYNTFDLASYKNGRFYIEGRKDDLIIPKSGENINPNLVEEKLRNDDIVELCLIPEKNNNAPILLVELNKYLSIEKANKILEALKEKIRLEKLNTEIGEIVLIKDKLIEEEDFKLNRKKILRKFNNHEYRLFTENANNNTSTDLDEVTLKIKEIFSNNFNREITDLDGDIFLELGGSSLDYFAIIGEIHEEFGLDLSKVPDSSLVTIRAISEYIKTKL